MPSVQLQSVALSPPDGTLLLNAMIDMPTAGIEQDSYIIRVEGWALTSGLKPEGIEIYAGNQRLYHTSTIVERPDVQAYFGDVPGAVAAGFYANFDTLLSSEVFELTVKLAFESGAEVQVGVIRGRRRSPTLHFTPTLQPLAVMGLGRSGTTLLMRYLTNHPQVVTHNQYPYELRMMSYMFHAHGVLGARADYFMSAHPDTFIMNNNWLGFNPYHEPARYDETVTNWFSQEYREELITFSMRSLDSFYRSQAETQQKREPFYFAEKIEAFGRNQYQWMMYPQSRALLLVRDFRDRHSSINSFNTKRGVVAFGLESTSSQEEYIEKTFHTFLFHWTTWRQRPDQVLLVRYEDMILQPRETVLKIIRFLELDDSLPLIEQMIRETQVETPSLQAHRTTEDGKQSIGRWKRDLDPKIAALYTERFREILQEMGYET